MSEVTHAKPTIDWLTWFLWVFVCTLVPVINTLSFTALNKPILRTDPDANLITIIVIIVVILPLLIPLIQYLVLRRISKINLVIWIIAIIYSWFIYSLSGHYNGKLLLQTTTVGFFSLIVPCLILGSGSGRKWFFFLIAAMAGILAEYIINQIYNINFYSHRIDSYALNNKSSLDRLQELGFRASVGAFFGAISGCVLLALFQYEDFKNSAYSKYQIYRNPILMFGVALLMAISAPAFIYLIFMMFFPY